MGGRGMIHELFFDGAQCRCWLIGPDGLSWWSQTIARSSRCRSASGLLPGWCPQAGQASAAGVRPERWRCGRACATAAPAGGRRIEGREAFKKWAEDFSAAIGNFDSEIVDSFENRDGSRVALTFRVTGTNNGAFGTKPDRSPIEMTGIVISAVRDDGMLLSNRVERSAFEVYKRLTAR